MALSDYDALLEWQTHVNMAMSKTNWLEPTVILVKPTHIFSKTQSLAVSLLDLNGCLNAVHL